MNQQSLYERLGGYDGLTAFANDLLPPFTRRYSIGTFLAKSRRRWYSKRKAITY